MKTEATPANVGSNAGLGVSVPENWRCFDYGCNGCDECTDYDDEPREPPEFGCCLPQGECCMPGLHFPSECHTAADYEREQFGGWASDAGPRKDA